MPDPHRLSRTEFIALLAMLFATVAFSIDSMLPALPEIGRALSPDNLNQAQLVLTSFVFGMGIGTFFTGPLSDSFGRKKVIVIGAALYIIASGVALFTQGMEMLLLARVVQGLGAAAPRVVGLAIVRDLYSGRDMARIMSFAMMVFTLVPAVAPLLGAGVISLVGWRGIFGSFVVFSILSTGWLILRQPESLPVDDRRPFQPAKIWEAVREMMAHPTVRLSIATQTLCFSTLFMSISLIQPIFDVVFDRGSSFPFWFGVVALMSGTASLLNASLVMRFGMRRMVTFAVALQILLSGGMSLIWLQFGTEGLGLDLMFFIFLVWITSVFFNAGLTLGNLNAITLEPMGHIAGTAASVSGGIATVISAAIAAPVGLTFNGTPLPLTLGVALAMVLALVVMLWMQRTEAREVLAAE